MASVLPAPEQYPDLVPAKDSPVYRYASDLRLTAVAGYALILQVAHPTVGAGVAEHSNFQQDPWGRLLRTLDYVNGTIYGGPELAGEIGRRVREMHRDIKGFRPDGERYHAMEPTAYAWVHATLASAVMEGHRRFGRPMTADVAERYYADWLKLGRLVGVREGDLPGDLTGFHAYFEEMCRTALVPNPAVGMVLDTLAHPSRPLKVIPRRLWRQLRRPAAWQMRITTVGTLPADLRDRLGIPWSERDERAVNLLGAISRGADPLVLGPVRVFGPLYVRLRRKPLARGDVARRSGGPPEVRAAA
jgi:uncharacterized protein (DUF2236 family)